MFRRLHIYYYVIPIFFTIGLSATAQVNITNVEYFIDSDPGVGTATPIPAVFSPATTINETFTIPTSSLAAGFHTLVIRAQDQNAIWSVQESRVFYVSQLNVTTQANITDIEYFLDSDPGVGNGTVLSGFSSNTVTASPLVSTSTLTAGFHVLFVRAMDSDGVWGNLEFRPFYIAPSSATATANIVELRYFIDSDPGYGNGTLIPVSTSSLITVNTTAATGTLPEGHHVLVVRALDSDGVWSNIETRSFYVNGATGGLLSSIEYFYDTDPGSGNGTTFTIAPAASSIDQNINLPTTALTTGSHQLGIRLITDNGTIGMTEYYSFTTCDVALPSFSSSIVCVGNTTNFADATTGSITGDVYSWDFDSDGIEDANTSGNQSYTYAASGSYTASLTIDRAGCISSTTVPVQVEPIASANAGIDQAICTNNATLSANSLNANETGTWSIVTGSATLTNSASPTSALTAIATDTVELSWTVTNTLGNCTAVDNVRIITASLITPSFTATSECTGSPTVFTNSSTNTVSGDTYSWDFDGDGIEDSNSSGNPSFTFSNSGAYMASLTITRGVCTTTTTNTVDVFALPIVSAGPDQSVCTQTATLAANSPAANETGLWQIINGAGTLANPSSPTTNVTGISTPTVELSWTVSNAITSCTQTDTVLISVNLPITATATNTTVAIGQSVNIDVVSAAATNPGDTVTVTIPTPPENGTAVVQTDNTITYTPNNNAPASDNFTFRITNQCNNIAEATSQITINNSPPTIDAQGFEIPANTTEISFDLTSLISDPNNNLDFSSLRIVTQPISGAIASINSNGLLMLDYRGVTFSGNDQLEVEVCDLVGVCTVQLIIIPNVNVGGENPPLKVFNAVSPNDDGIHDFLEIQNIEFYPENTVIILNRWGSKVAEFTGYNNQNIVFTTTTLPEGTYYYHILPNKPDVKSLSGFFVLQYDPSK